MKYLKLFEAFSQDEKIEGANNIVIEYLLFKSFVKNNIIVKRDYDERHGMRFIFLEKRILKPWEDRESNRTHVEILTYDGIRIYEVCGGTSRYIRRTLFVEMGYRVDPSESVFRPRTHEQEKLEMEIDRISESKEAYQAAKRYIDYLKMTPDKKHLLEE